MAIMGDPPECADVATLLPARSARNLVSPALDRRSLYIGGSRRDYFDDVPVFLSAGASNQTYLIADIAPDRKTRKVHQVNGNNWPSRQPIAVIPVR